MVSQNKAFICALQVLIKSQYSSNMRVNKQLVNSENYSLNWSVTFNFSWSLIIDHDTMKTIRTENFFPSLFARLKPGCKNKSAIFSQMNKFTFMHLRDIYLMWLAVHLRYTFVHSYITFLGNLNTHI